MSGIPDRCWMEVDAFALRYNLRAIRKAIPRGTGLMAIVKANAYGHGVEPIARECSRFGATWFGVANLREAMGLRKLGFKQPILILSAVLPGEMTEAVRRGFVLAISSLDEARQLAAVGRKLQRKARVHFKVDVGMGRLGIWHEEATLAIALSRILAGLSVEGVMTHFPCSDDNAALTKRQWQNFDRVRRVFPKLCAHVANSPSIFSAIPSLSHYEMVRPGIALYGAGPTAESERLLRPVLTWKSRVSHVDYVPAGRTISYGATYRLHHAETHAVVSVGYADGYHRLLSNRAEVLIHGKRCPLRGRVTMDQIVVDVSRAGAVKPGDEVVLIGRQGREEITANEMARWAETISYELFTSISPRVVRYYKNFK